MTNPENNRFLLLMAAIAFMVIGGIKDGASGFSLLSGIGGILLFCWICVESTKDD